MTTWQVVKTVNRLINAFVLDAVTYLQQARGHGGNAAEDLAVRVDDVPAAGLRDLLRIGDERRHP